MKKLLRQLIRREEGNVILLVSLSFMGLLVMVGLVIDGGTMYMTKSHLQKTANAAVLSGAQELTNREDSVREVVTEVLKSHQEETSIQELSITMGKRVEIELKKTVPLSFSKLFGFNSLDVHSNAAAELRVMARAIGAAPLGIDDSIALEFYKKYQLKVDSTGVEYGNFGVLALGGPGANTYEENLRKGYNQEISVGDIIETQTGNIAGKTRAAVKERVDGCLHTETSIYDRNCSRIILIPTYTPYEHDTNQMKSIKITGFAYFYITDPMDSKDTSITGMFIERAGTGFEGSNGLSKGAFAIRLTE
ncbi:pilus assembly protein TadG-related protein [Cytobacillus sp. FJAT-54145]|uniref:Pilus assembly protein TadG-related protein n=1 Tax=Cytobacillus spartinae TaxID=3299023 RepID=A0ABW6K610_9BACI